MHIVTQARGFDLSEELREHVERRLGFAIDRARHRVGRISVILSDVNGRAAATTNVATSSSPSTVPPIW